MTVSFHKYGNFFPGTGHMYEIGQYFLHFFGNNLNLNCQIPRTIIAIFGLFCYNVSAEDRGFKNKKHYIMSRYRNVDLISGSVCTSSVSEASRSGSGTVLNHKSLKKLPNIFNSETVQNSVKLLLLRQVL
jgi:hypothetical protein